MKTLARICVLLLLLGQPFAAVRAANPYELSPRQTEILQTIMDAQNGYITREIYDEFWTGFPLSADERVQLADYLRSFMLKGQRYIRATWSSALLSLQSGRYTESEDYQQAKQDSLEAMRAMPGVSSAQLERSIERSEALIAAAAAHTPFEVKAGEKTYITEDLVATVISGIDGTLDRIDLLVRPEWQPEDKELSLPEASLKMLMPWHMSRTVSVREVENGMQIPTTTYIGALDAASFVSVGYADYGTIDLPFNYRKGMFGAARGAFDAGGLKPTNAPAQERWRGHDSVVAWGTGSVQGRPIAGYMRVFRPTGRKGLTMIFLVGEGSITDLSVIVDQIEHKLTIVE